MTLILKPPLCIFFPMLFYFFSNCCDKMVNNVFILVGRTVWVMMAYLSTYSNASTSWTLPSCWWSNSAMHNWLGADCPIPCIDGMTHTCVNFFFSLPELYAPYFVFLKISWGIYSRCIPLFYYSSKGESLFDKKSQNAKKISFIIIFCGFNIGYGWMRALKLHHPFHQLVVFIV